MPTNVFMVTEMCMSSSVCAGTQCKRDESTLRIHKYVTEQNGSIGMYGNSTGIGNANILISLRKQRHTAYVRVMEEGLYKV